MVEEELERLAQLRPARDDLGEGPAAGGQAQVSDGATAQGSEGCDVHDETKAVSERARVSDEVGRGRVEGDRAHKMGKAVLPPRMRKLMTMMSQ